MVLKFLILKFYIMAKSPVKKSAAKDTKSKAAFASTREADSPSATNASKYSPTSEVKMNEQSLDAADGLLKLFTESVKDIYWAEKQLVKALPKMAKSAGNAELANAIEDHLEQTRIHAERLEQVFSLLGKKPQARKCDAMEGLTKEGEAVIEDTDKGTAARDMGIIMASQKVEYYEIAAYTGLIKLGNKLGLTAIADILSETLTEEQDADDLLAEIADNQIMIEE
jgi:ferritin-like metal-binding protein YciE